MAKPGWAGFVSDYGIPWTMGSGRRNIEISCPWCQDGSMKLGLSLENTLFGCWKHQKDHGGANPARLIRFLLGVSYEHAQNISDTYFDYVYTARESKLDKEADPVQMPSMFKAFSGQPYELRFMQYLLNRGLDPSYVIPRFDLRACTYPGAYNERLIIPVRENKFLYTWVGRAIDNNPQRFKAASEPFTANKLPDYLHDVDNLSGGKYLVLVEGAFDSMALTQAFIPGLSATCTFGKNMSEPQQFKFIQVAQRYQFIVIGYDATALDSTLKLSRQLRWHIRKPILSVKPPEKDWCLTPRESIKSVFSQLAA